MTDLTLKRYFYISKSTKIRFYKGKNIKWHFVNLSRLSHIFWMAPYLNVVNGKIFFVGCHFFGMSWISRTCRCCRASVLWGRRDRSPVVPGREIGWTSVGLRCDFFGLEPRLFHGVPSNARFDRAKVKNWMFKMSVSNDVTLLLQLRQ